MRRVYDLPEFPPVGTRCMYRNPALNLDGWGVIADPRDPGDADDLPYREVTSTGPMGQALMKARVGDTVRVNLPKGEKRLTIIIIH